MYKLFISIILIAPFIPAAAFGSVVTTPTGVSITSSTAVEPMFSIASVLKTYLNPAEDFDKDGLDNATEVDLKTDPYNSDSDKDGFTDNEEVYSGYNPLVGNKDRKVTRRVVVDRTAQQMYVYLNDVKIYSIPVSTGLIRTQTPEGEFTIMRKVPVVHYIGPGYNLPNTKWNLEFKKHYYLHGAYWHNKFGIKPMSHGCVNISYANAEKLYKFLDVGDKVKVIGKTPVGKVKVASL